MNNAEMIKLTNAHIPSGMYLSVDWDNNQPQPHPVGDASLMAMNTPQQHIKKTHYSSRFLSSLRYVRNDLRISQCTRAEKAAAQACFDQRDKPFSAAAFSAPLHTTSQTVIPQQSKKSRTYCILASSTERHIPNGMQFHKLKSLNYFFFAPFAKNLCAFAVKKFRINNICVNPDNLRHLRAKTYTV